MGSLDRKYAIHATSREHGTIHTDDDAVLFLAKDKAFVATFPTYIANLHVLGAEDRQIRSAQLLYERLIQWGKDHPQSMKVPDIDDTPFGRSLAIPDV